MRRMIILATAAMSLMACTQDIGSKVVALETPFHGSFHQEETRTYLDEGLQMYWHEDDRVTIFTTTANQQYRFTGRSGDKSGDFEIVTDGGAQTGSATATNYAVYPYNTATALTTDGQLTIELPAEQQYAERTFGKEANAMVAVTAGNGDHELSFRNLCGYVVVQVYGSATVKSLELRGNNGEKIAGKAYSTPTHGSAPTMEMSAEEATETITLDCGEGVTISQEESAPTEFWFVVPPVTFSKGFTVTITDTEEMICQRTTTTPRTITRNVVNKMDAADIGTFKSGDYIQYDWDGEVVTLQEGIEGVDIILMGDGFIKKDFDDGTYDRIMRKTYEEIFSIEPYATLKSNFHVAYVKAVSPERVLATNTGQNGAINSGTNTKFSTKFTAYSTNISGDNRLAREYASKALDGEDGERIESATVVVIINQECHAGTTHTSIYGDEDYSKSSSVAYCALGLDEEDFIKSIHHEICGHGYGKLADEYTSTRTLTTTQPWEQMDSYHRRGLYRNVDKYVNQNLYDRFEGAYELTTTQNVYWSDMFGTANNYESNGVESLGVYEGAYLYPTGFCRPTQDGSRSIMYRSVGTFNAISRRQIYYRTMRLSGQIATDMYGTEEELNRFLEWDAQNMLPKMVTTRAGAAKAHEETESMDGMQPLAEPVIYSPLTHSTMIPSTSGAKDSSISLYSEEAPDLQCWKR